MSMRYELWKRTGITEKLAFFAVDENYYHQRRSLKAGAELVWSVNAESWNEAMTRYYKFMVWEPYVAMEDE